ncbi:hypothetical protein [Pyxidicoccus xibeiensis]|uniref:hypothetical protein n=1 Tax=Pyxidicoccus xibeiensis TaxID=2906759 RepID=UPI0020A77A84|nr:hypothetical protein [Pyxidicoccus xibeiensis]MCP3143250.1 hypothetical protein [Pyxidicoccus xibeiensis]
MSFKIISWNIFRFATGIVQDTTRINRVLDLVNPATGPAYDVFVILEPQNVDYQEPGDIAVGAGSRAIHMLLGKLRGRPGGGGWEVAPPRALNCGGKESETIAVFYNSANLVLDGPESSTRVPPPWNLRPDTPGKLYWVDRSAQKIRRANRDGTSPQDVSTTDEAQSLQVSLRYEELYWIDTLTNTICCSDLDGTNRTVLVTPSNPSQLALDEFNGMMYWLDSGTTELWRAYPDGSGPKKVETKNKTVVKASSLMGFTPHTSLRMELYWGDATANAALKLSKDSKNKVSLRELNIVDPTGFTVDTIGEKMYWIEQGTNNICSASLDGKGALDLLTGATPTELVLDVTNAHLYWINAANHTIKRMDVDGNNETDLVAPELPDAVRLDGTGRRFWLYKGTKRLRRADAGGLNAVDVVTTGQPDALAVDGTNDKLYWVDRAVNEVWWADLDGKHGAAVVTTGQPDALAVDETNSKLYWVDRAVNEVWWADLDGTNAAAVVTTGQPEDLAVDGTNGKLYWVDRAVNQVWWADLDGTNAAALITTGQPEDLAVDETNGKLYWVDRAVNQVWWADLDGTNAVALVTTGQPDALTLAPGGTKLFWLDSTQHGFRQADVNGTNEVAAELPGRPKGLVLDTNAGKMYWIDASTDYIRRANLDGTSPADVIKGEKPDALVIFPGSFLVGQCTYEDATPAEILFDKAHERRPYLVQFKETAATARQFCVVAMHAPSPSQGGNKKAQNGTSQLGEILEITTNRGTMPVVVVGDFNCCTLPNLAVPPCAPLYQGHDQDVTAFNSLTGGPGYALHIDVRTSLKSSPSLDLDASTTPPHVKPPAYTQHSYDHILTVGFTTVANARLVDLVAREVSAWYASQPPHPVPVLASNTFTKTLFGRIFKGSGLSDHLPVEVEVTL